MKPGIVLAKQLKQFSFPDSHVREMRALFVAQSLAYQCPLSLQKTAEDILSECREHCLDVINDTNEVLALDTKLTQSLLEKMIRSRLEILQSVSDTTLLTAALASPSLTSRLSEDDKVALTSLVSQPDFAAHAKAATAAFAQDSSEPRDE